MASDKASSSLSLWGASRRFLWLFRARAGNLWAWGADWALALMLIALLLCFWRDRGASTELANTMTALGMKDAVDFLRLSFLPVMTCWGMSILIATLALNLGPYKGLEVERRAKNRVGAMAALALLALAIDPLGLGAPLATSLGGMLLVVQLPTLFASSWMAQKSKESLALFWVGAWIAMALTIWFWWPIKSIEMVLHGPGAALPMASLARWGASQMVPMCVFMAMAGGFGGAVFSGLGQLALGAARALWRGARKLPEFDAGACKAKIAAVGAGAKTVGSLSMGALVEVARQFKARATELTPEQLAAWEAEELGRVGNGKEELGKRGGRRL